MSSSKGTFIIGNLLKVTNKKTTCIPGRLPWTLDFPPSHVQLSKFLPLWIVRDLWIHLCYQSDNSMAHGPLNFDLLSSHWGYLEDSAIVWVTCILSS